MDGATRNEGRVEICFDNEWGSICDDNWGVEEAQVVCRQLNYTERVRDSIPFTGAFFGGAITAIHLDEMNCNGNETMLAACQHAGVGNHNCVHAEDAGVLCVGENIDR